MRSAHAFVAPTPALKSGGLSRSVFWPALAVLVVGLLAAAPRAAAQSAKLADMPPPPSASAPPPSNSAGSSASAGDSSSQPSAGESSSKADAGESSSKADDRESSSSSSAKGGPDDNYNPDDSLKPQPSSPNRPSLRRRGAPAAAPAAAAAAAAADPDQPAFDPLHADRSLDVGLFYFKKGQYDAAIDRYQEAAQLNPKMAKPYLLLGEAYEKKNSTAEALAAYRKYLAMFSNAPDRAKVQERIDKLQGKTGHSGAGSG